MTSPFFSYPHQYLSVLDGSNSNWSDTPLWTWFTFPNSCVEHYSSYPFTFKLHSFTDFVHVYVHAPCAMHMSACHRITWGNLFSPSTMWVQDQTMGIKLHRKGLYLPSHLKVPCMYSIEKYQFGLIFYIYLFIHSFAYLLWREVYVDVHVCAGMNMPQHMWSSQRTNCRNHLFLCGSWGSNLGPQPWQTTEPPWRAPIVHFWSNCLLSPLGILVLYIFWTQTCCQVYHFQISSNLL